MADIITPELFDYLVELAALELASDEAEYLRQQLNQQLAAIRELERIEVPDGIPPAAHGVPFSTAARPALREDQPVPSDLAPALLAASPDTDDGYFIVPEIQHQEL